MLEFMEIASNWGERNDIAVTFYRNEIDWFARLEYRVGKGWRSVHVPMVGAKKQKKLDHIQTHIEKKLSLAIMMDRKRHIETFTKANPQARVA